MLTTPPSPHGSAILVVRRWLYLRNACARMNFGTFEISESLESWAEKFWSFCIMGFGILARAVHENSVMRTDLRTLGPDYLSQHS